MVAGVGVVMNKTSKDQIHFGAGNSKTTKGHSDDILCLAISPCRTKVATGQCGKKPIIYIWSVEDCSIIHKFKLGRVRAVKTIGWSSDGKYIGATCMDNDHQVVIFDAENGGKALATGEGGDCCFFDMAFDPTEPTRFCTVGKRPKLWNYNNGLKGGSLAFGSKKRTVLIVGEFLENG